MAVKHSTRGGDRAAPPVERAAQRRRTRKAIVDATIRLLAQGKTPSVVDVANAADVSRRTVYMYFPTFDQLLIPNAKSDNVKEILKVGREVFARHEQHAMHSAPVLGIAAGSLSAKAHPFCHHDSQDRC